MAKKYRKLAIAPDGRIVDRTTGRLVSGEPELRGNRVYIKGRLYGYTAQGTKAQQAQIQKTAQAREKREKAQARKDIADLERNGLPDQKKAISAVDTSGKQATANIKKYFRKNKRTADALKAIYEKHGGRTGEVEVSMREQSLINYGLVLDKAVASGKLTYKQAFNMLKKMNGALDADARTRIWRATAKLFDRLGYKYDLGFSLDSLKDIEDDFFDS